MTSFTFFSLCLVILVAHWVRCESEQSADKGEVRLRREDALELYDILKRALKKRQSNVSSSLNFDNKGLSSGNVDLSHSFGSNSQHSVTGKAGWDRQGGWNGGVGLDLNSNDGRTNLNPSVNFDSNGYKSSSVGLSHTFGQNNQNKFGVSVGHDRDGGLNAGIGVNIPFGRRTNF